MEQSQNKLNEAVLSFLKIQYGGQGPVSEGNWFPFGQPLDD